MMSTSSDGVVLRGDLGATATAVADQRDLRAGTWTRLGASTVLGDSATEATLGALADRSRAAGLAQGYAAGWAEGRRRAQEEADRAATERAAADEQATHRLRAAQEQLVASLADTVARCDAELAARSRTVAAEATELGLRIAEAVLGRELAAMSDRGAEAVRRAVAAAPQTLAATVRLHPDDAAALDRAVLEGRAVTVLADPAVPPGGALLDTEVTSVDATLESALDRVRAALIPTRGA
jgi:flagellar assembly protein FliH